MEPVTCCEEDFGHFRWYASEKRVEKIVIQYFKEREYKVISHCCQDQFDIVAANIISGPKIDSFIRIEIKSKKDTLERLDNQIAEYLQLFDFAYVKKVVDFIEQKSASISELGLFVHECGRAKIAGG